MSPPLLTRILALQILFRGMLRKVEYQPCIPTRGTEVPTGPDWFHEIKHDGYRLLVQREGKRVRLLTRRGYYWSDRYPLITESSLRLRKSHCDRWRSGCLGNRRRFTFRGFARGQTQCRGEAVRLRSSRRRWRRHAG